MATPTRPIDMRDARAVDQPAEARRGRAGRCRAGRHGSLRVDRAERGAMSAGNRPQQLVVRALRRRSRSARSCSGRPSKLAAQRRLVDRDLVAVDMRQELPSAIRRGDEKADALRRRVGVLRRASCRCRGRQELGEDRRRGRAARRRHSAATATLCRRNRHSISVHWPATADFAPAPAEPAAACWLDRTSAGVVAVRIIGSRMRGSSTASRMSEISMPTSVSDAHQQDEAAGEVHVLADQRAQQQRAGRRQVEHDGGDRDAGDQRRQHPADRRDERVERDAHRIAQDQREFRQALGAGGHDIGLVEFVGEVGAHDADQRRGAVGADHDDRDPEMRAAGPRTWPSSTARPRYSGENRPPTLCPKIPVGDIHQHQRQEEVRDGEAEEAEKGEDVVADRIAAHRRVDADRQRDRPDQKAG